MAATDTRLIKRGTKLGKDVWSVRLDLPVGPDGRRRRRRWTFIGTRSDASRALRARLVALERDEIVEPDRSKLTLGQFLADWLATAKLRLAGKTWERYDAIVRMHLAPALGGLRLQQITVAGIERAYARWLEQGLSALTIVHHSRVLGAALATAVRQGRLRANPVALAVRPRVTRREMRLLSLDEIGRLLRAAAGTPPFELFLTLAIGTGARRGELCGIRWSDVDLERGTIAISRSVEITKHAGIVIKAPKSGRPRIVHLPASAIEMLRAARPSPATGYVFPGDGEAPWSPNAVTNCVRAIFRRAGISGASLHSCRHACASILLSRGVSVRAVQTQLGHSTPSLTLGTYVHLQPEATAESARRLDDVLAPIVAPAD